MTEKTHTTRQVYFPDSDLVQKVKEACGQEKSFAQFVVEAIEEKLEREEK